MFAQNEVSPTVIKPYHPQVPREEMENLYRLSRAKNDAIKALLLSQAITALNRQIEGEVDGKNIKEPLYRKPDKVVYSFKDNYTHVNLLFDGVVYNTERATNGSLGFMEGRSTVIIKHKDNRYYRLYFDDKEILKAGTILR